jgi:sterol desaturase/sphingolipid hydroxylase (fatty acid hydroxylase superfamily)
MDFVAWLSHLARHKVPFFWGFHSVHHAQRNLNFFTEYRSHIMDELLKYTLEALPLFMLEQSFVQIATINQLRYWHSAFYHANVKSNHGFLRYFIVTPQSHRVHHSIEPQHRDTNFGSSFSIWDQIFGTQCKDYDAYPDTGIEDPFFPVDQSQSLKNSLKTFFAQFFYPLKLPSFKK